MKNINNINKQFVTGFIKRANQYGISDNEAINILKRAEGMFNTTPPAGIEHMGAGMQQAYGSPLSASMPNMKPLNFNSPPPQQPPAQIAQGAIMGGLGGAMGEQAQQLQQPDMNALFRKYHGGAFDPHSKMDQFKMQQLQAAQQSGGSLLAAADVPYNRSGQMGAQ